MITLLLVILVAVVSVVVLAGTIACLAPADGRAYLTDRIRGRGAGGGSHVRPAGDWHGHAPCIEASTPPDVFELSDFPADREIVAQAVFHPRDVLAPWVYQALRHASETDTTVSRMKPWVAEHLPAGVPSTDVWLDRLFAPVLAQARLALEAGSA